MITKEKFHAVIADLKGQMKTLSNEHVNNKQRVKDAQRKYAITGNYNDISIYYKYEVEAKITTLAILYNQIRNRPEHTGNDAEYLSRYCLDYPGFNHQSKYDEWLKYLLQNHGVVCEPCENGIVLHDPQAEVVENV